MPDSVKEATETRVVQLGQSASSLLVIDRVTAAERELTQLAAMLGPFPAARGNSYPGRRRFITPTDQAAANYSRQLLRALIGPINATFDCAGFDLLEASFSMVTAHPDQLTTEQRAPHFDSTDPRYLAVLHYLSGVQGSGTAFYRQRVTDIERVTDDNVDHYLAQVRRESGVTQGYIDASNHAFEQIGRINAVADRVIVYQGALLHSGIIPPDMSFSDDPRRGRLTANFFVLGRPRQPSAA